MDTLPKELHLLILFSFIPRIQDRCKLSSTCHYFRNLYHNGDPDLDKKNEMMMKNRGRPDNGLVEAAGIDHMDLVGFFVEKGATDWDRGMQSAAKGGHAELVRFFAEKGAANWNWAMSAAAEGGHAELVRFFVEKGATDWDRGMQSAEHGGHADLVAFLKEKMNCR